MRSSGALVLLVLTLEVLATTVLGCRQAPAPAPLPGPPSASVPAVGPRASSAPPPAAPSADAAAVAALAKTPGTSFAGLWLRRLAAAWASTHDANAPEVELAARELHRAVQWGSLDEELQVLGSAAIIAPAFENAQVPVAVHAAKSADRQADYGSAIQAATEARRPRLVAIFEKLGADGRRHMLFGIGDAATIADFFAVAARDGVCPAVKDDRDLSWKAWSSPSSAKCAPPPLPEGELHDVDRLSAELAGPWPRAVRAIAALRDMRDRERDRFKPDLAQQKHFVEGCMMHPMCPLWLIDHPDPALRPTLEEASAKATPAQRRYLEKALAAIRGKTEELARDPAEIDLEVTTCVRSIDEVLARTTGEPWMREARAQHLRSECLHDVNRASRASLDGLVNKTDAPTAALLLGAMIERGGALPAAEIERVAADLRTRFALYRALAAKNRTREMPAEWKKEDALVVAEAFAWVDPHYGGVPENVARFESSKVTFQNRRVTVAYVRMTSTGEHAKLPPVEVAVGPLRPGVAYETSHDLTGTDWGNDPRGVRAFVEEHANDARSVSLFENFQ